MTDSELKKNGSFFLQKMCPFWCPVFATGNRLGLFSAGFHAPLRSMGAWGACQPCCVVLVCIFVLCSERGRLYALRLLLVRILYALRATYFTSVPHMGAIPRTSHVKKTLWTNSMFCACCVWRTARTHTAATLRTLLGSIWCGPPVIRVCACLCFLSW